jgi:hypothetical protein
MRLALLALVVLVLAACGDGGQDGGLMSIQDALRADGQTVIVEGGIVATDGGPVRLCYALLESYPPQCGEPALELRGLDLDALELETSAATRPCRPRAGRFAPSEFVELCRTASSRSNQFFPSRP